VRLLWVDDQASLVRTFAPLLEGAGHSIAYEPGAESAIVRLAEDTFDLVLADLAMPPGRWGGLWFLQEIRRLDIKVPVMVVSGEGSQLETIEALRLGAADYVMKERLDTELLEQIDAVIRNAPPMMSDTDRLRSTLAAGETDTVEFKSTLRWNIKANRVDPAIELSAIKTIAAFLNTSGGTLLIGVTDEGTVIGLDTDAFPNDDKLQLHFWNRIRDSLGAASASFIGAKIVCLEGGRVLRIDCRKSSQPIYVRWKIDGENRSTELFFVRTGPKTERLDLRDAIQYIQDNFTKFAQQ
jgi:DNA-binding response OmpR family regulator